MSECCACSKAIPEERAKMTNGNPRKYCDQKCYLAWRIKKGGGIKQLSNVERHKDRVKIEKAMVKALKGDTVARAFLRRAIGLRGLWNPETQEMERW